MNGIAKLVAVAIALLVPALSFAQQTNGPVTRAQVRAELARIERAGYKPAGRDNKYPNDLWAAEARAAAADAHRSLQPGGAVPMNAPNTTGD
jgi:hypothetical protein